VFLIVADKVGYDLGIGLSLKFAAIRRQAFLEREIIFDDAVVNYDDLPGLISMRVSIFLGGTPVRRPARVADAVIAVERVQPNTLFKIAKLPLRPSQFKVLMIIDDGDPSRVVASIFQFP
jgi:hypothetical protein